MVSSLCSQQGDNGGEWQEVTTKSARVVLGNRFHSRRKRTRLLLKRSPLCQSQLRTPTRSTRGLALPNRSPNQSSHHPQTPFRKESGTIPAQRTPPVPSLPPRPLPSPSPSPSPFRLRPARAAATKSSRSRRSPLLPPLLLRSHSHSHSHNHSHNHNHTLNHNRSPNRSPSRRLRAC